MSSEEQAGKWREAQSIGLSLPLVPAALQHLRFLSQVDHHRCLYQGPAVSRAIQRYEECWLPLLAASGNGLTPDGLPLQPPLDCAWIWHCHRLNPTSYAQDCEAIYGRILVPAPACMDEEKPSESTCRIWMEHFPLEPYTLDLTQFHYDKQWQPPKHGESPKFKYNLHEAAARQSAFYYQVCRPHMRDESYLRGAEQRYKGFLHLYRLTENKFFLVPTYDIDLIWHAHQLNVKAYTEDLKRILDRLLPHDDSVSDRTPGANLEKSSILTHKLWVESYGIAYVREGAMYRGEPPAPIPLPPQVPKVTSLPDIGASFLYTIKAPREVIQVTLTILGAQNLPVTKRSAVRVRLQMANKCSNFRIESRELNSRAVWDYTLRFEAERTTEGLQLEVLQRRYNSIKQKISGSKLLGRIRLSWESLMQSPTLCRDDWFELSPKTKPTIKRPLKVEPTPSLFISLSWTPPQPGSHLFRTAESAPTDNELSMVLDNSAAKDKCWMTRTVIDHAHREVFVVRARYNEDRGRIHVHDGGWIYEKGRAPDKVVFTAEEAEQKIANQRLWSLFDSNTQLVVSRAASDPHWKKGVVLDLKGSLQTQVVLACGRRLEYEVKGAKEEEEVGFVTIIRYNLADTPHGRATALLNWITGKMEVSSEESVALVLLLSNIIALSVLDMKCLESTVRPKKEVTRQKNESSADEWGSLVFENTCTSRFSKGLHYQHWWKTAPMIGIPSSLEGNWIKANGTMTKSKEKNKSKGQGKSATTPRKESKPKNIAKTPKKQSESKNKAPRAYATRASTFSGSKNIAIYASAAGGGCGGGCGGCGGCGG